MGSVYDGKVVRVADFGAFLEILPGQDGIVHISDLDIVRTERVEDVAQLGDILKVKVTNVDPTGKVRLSRKAVLIDALPEEERAQYAGQEEEFRGGGGGRGGDRGGRGRPRQTGTG